MASSVAVTQHNVRWYLAMSGISGRPMASPSREVLCEAALAHGYKSPYWVTMKQLATLSNGTEQVRPGQVPVQIRLTKELDAAMVDLYNADQTTTPLTIAKYVEAHGRFHVNYRPRSAVTGLPLRQRTLLCHTAIVRKFKSEFWLTQAELAAAFGGHIQILPGETGTEIPAYTGTNAPTVLFNAKQTTDPAAVIDRASKIVPMLSIRGKPFTKAEHQLALQAAYDRHKYTSAYWISAEDIELMNTGAAGAKLTVKPNEIPVTIPWRKDGAESTKALYNADQTTSPSAVSAYAAKMRATLRAYSGVSGRPYPSDIQQALFAGSEAKRYSSPYWVTKGQLRSFLPPLEVRPGEVGVTHASVIEGKSVDVTYFNTEQLADPMAIGIHLSALGGAPSVPLAKSPTSS